MTKWINAQFQVHTLPVCETLDPKPEAKQMEVTNVMGTLMLLVVGKYFSLMFTHDHLLHILGILSNTDKFYST